MLNEIGEGGRATGLKPRLGTAIDPAKPLRLRGPLVETPRLLHRRISVLEWASVDNGSCFKIRKDTVYSGTRLPTYKLYIASVFTSILKLEVTCSIEKLVSPTRLYGVVGKIPYFETSLL